MIREQLDQSVDCFIDESKRYLYPLPTILLQCLWQFVANLDRPLWILGIEVIASDVRLTILAMNEGGIIASLYTLFNVNASTSGAQTDTLTRHIPNPLSEYMWNKDRGTFIDVHSLSFSKISAKRDSV